MRNSFYWELAVEHRDKDGDLIGDMYVLIAIWKGKIDKDVRSISDNFDISLKTIMNNTFTDQENNFQRGFKNYDGSTFEFVIIKNECNDEDGILNRDWIYPDPRKAFEPVDYWWLECWSEELPKYVLDAVEKLLEGESK
jgi:hypothetical protein